jgi:predicted glycosyltransferase
VGIVAMAGYNTFCEILSLDKRAILVPRVVPRREQLIRANRAAALGLVRTLDPQTEHDPAVMAAALRALPGQPKPSERGAMAMLDGLVLITDLAAAHAAARTDSAASASMQRR